MEAGSLGFSITVFTICAVLSIILLMVRRIFGRGELGGPKATRYASAMLLLFLWLSYVLLSALETYGNDRC